MSNRNWGFIDFRLKLNSIAWQVLHALDSEPVFAPWDAKQGCYKLECETYAWYNGRERGFTIHVTHPDRLFQNNLYVVFAEQRNSDSIVVYSWTRNHPYLNPPTPRDLDEVWDKTEARNFTTISEAVDHIRGTLMHNFLAEEEKMAVVTDVLRK